MSVSSIHPSFCADFTRSEQKEFSATDWKTHIFVVLSCFLTMLGIALAFASFYLAPIIHPIISLGSAIVSITLGILLHPKKTEKKPILGQPLGLHRKGLNCWLNAAFQLICNIPAYRKILEKLKTNGDAKSRTLIDAFDQYQKERENPPADLVSTVDTQQLREWLHDLNDYCSESSLEAGDSYHFLEEFLSHQNQPILVKKTFQYGELFDKPRKANADSINLCIIRGKSDSLKKTLLTNYFNICFNNKNIIRYYESPPDDLTILFANPNKNKILDIMEFSLSRNELGEDAIYRCDGFVNFQGELKKLGHYTACFLQDGQWWKADDRKVQKISQDKVEKTLETSRAIIHYQKVRA